MNKIKKNESGQILVEYALVLPIFLLLVFFLIDFGWLVFQKSTFNYNCRKSSWAFTAPQEEEYVLSSNREMWLGGYDASYYLKQAFDKEIGSKGYINLKNIYIRSGLIHIIPGHKTYKNTAPQVLEEQLDKPHNDAVLKFNTITFEIKADVEYEVSPLTPLSKLIMGDKVVFKYDLYKIRRGSMRRGRAY